MYIPFQNNPLNKRTDDCVIRAISKALDEPWEKIYIDLCLKGLEMADWGNNNAVWDSYLRGKGFRRESIPNTCPDCYTLNQFCKDNPAGEYLVCSGSHVVFVKDGSFYDSWNSEDVVPIYAYRKE